MKYYSQKKAWIIGEILDSYLTAFNSRMKAVGRSVLLLIDNAGCHPESLKDKYSNIQIVFLPANTTSRLQPLDLGIIVNFKTHYRRLLLHFVIAKIDTASNATEVTSSISVLLAIGWVDLAWQKVNSSTIVKCFKTAGVLDDSFNVTERISEDPFADVDECIPLTTLISSAIGSCACSELEYIEGVNELVVCADIDDDHWEEDFMDGLMTCTSSY